MDVNQEETPETGESKPRTPRYRFGPSFMLKAPRAVSPIILQSLVIPGKKVEDGTIIEDLAIPWRMIAKMIAEDPNILFKIDPRKMEELIAAAFVQAGYDEVILTPRSGDLGRDVIAEKWGFLSVRIIGSVKAYKPGHYVTADDVRALAGVVSADHSASKGIVTTTSDFAPRIWDDRILKPLMPHRLELFNGERLNQWFLELANKDVREGREGEIILFKNQLTG